MAGSSGITYDEQKDQSAGLSKGITYDDNSIPEQQQVNNQASLSDNINRAMADPLDALKYGGAHAARAIAGGLASIPDIVNMPRNLVVDAAAKFYNNPALQALKAPSLSNMATSKIDQLTGGYSKPENDIQKTADIVGQLATGIVATPELALNAAKEAAASAGRTLKSPITYVGSGVNDIGRGLNPENIKSLMDNTGEIKDFATATLENVRRSGQGIKQKDVQSIIDGIENEVSNAVTYDPSGLHRQYTDAIDYLKAESAKGDVPIGVVSNFITKLRKAASSQSEDAGAAITAKDYIGQAISDLPETALSKQDAPSISDWRGAQSDYARAKGLEDVGALMKRAQKDPEKIRTGLRKILENPKLAGRFSSDEIAQMQETANASNGEKLLRLLGKTGIDIGTDTAKGRLFNSLLTKLAIGGGGGGAALAGGAGLATSGGLAATIPAIGTAANVAQKALVQGKMDRLVEKIVNRPNLSTKIPKK